MPKFNTIYGKMVGVETDLIPWLNQALDDRGWTQRELGRRAGISHATISNVLSYQRKPSWEFCAAIAKALPAPVDDVLILAGHKRPPPPAVAEEGELLTIIRSLSDSERATVMRQLRALASDAPQWLPPSPPLPVEAEPFEAELLAEFDIMPDVMKEDAIRQLKNMNRWASKDD